MRKTRFTLTGKDAFASKISRASVSAQQDVQRAVNKAGQLVRSEAVKEISKGSRSGKQYKRGNKYHVASAPGEFPKTDTGDLVSNITVEPDGPLSITVGSRVQAPQGYWLETKESSQGGRPWLGPIIRKRQKSIFDLVQRAVKKAIEG